MCCGIGEFAQKTGLSVHTLRYYEQEGLLTPARNQANRRMYTEQDLAWVAFIRRLKATGMPLGEIRRFAQLRAQGGATTAPRLAMLIDHRAQLDRQIAQLIEHRQKLDEKIGFYRRELARGEAAEPAI